MKERLCKVNEKAIDFHSIYYSCFVKQEEIELDQKT